MTKLLTPLFIIMASPALAAGDKPFFSLANTDFVVTIAFLIFIGILLYYKVPAKERAISTNFSLSFLSLCFRL